MKHNFIFLIFFSLICLNQIGFSQFVEQEQITVFGCRSKSPIKISVVSHRDQVTFYALNTSYYPYILKVDFTLVNLTPMVPEKTFIIGHGKIRLVSFRIHNENAGYDYSYKYSYRIKETEEIPDSEYPYLFPVGNNKIFSDYYPNEYIYTANLFSNLNRGDTIYCMRKGIVTAKPGVKLNIDRISNSKNAIEVLHEDGSVMVYQGISEEKISVSVGDRVYPGQILGFTYGSYLYLSLYSIKEGGKVSSNEIKYISGNKAVGLFDQFTDEKSAFHEEVIVKEMTSSEKRKLQKGKLY